MHAVNSDPDFGWLDQCNFLAFGGYSSCSNHRKLGERNRWYHVKTTEGMVWQGNYIATITPHIPQGSTLQSSSSCACCKECVGCPACVAEDWLHEIHLDTKREGRRVAVCTHHGDSCTIQNNRKERYS